MSPSADQSSPASASQSSRDMLRQLVAMAIPTFGQLIAEPVFILIDTAIVGHVNDSALAGLSIGSTIILTTVGLCVFLAYGTTSRVAHLMGAGHRREGFEEGVSGLWLALAIGVAVAAIIGLTARPLCSLLGAQGSVLDNATAYLLVMIGGLPGALLVYACNGILRGLERTRLTLVAAVCGAAMNTILDVIMVIGLGWGIVGSGVATLIAQWLTCLIMLVPTLRWAHDGGARLAPRMKGILSSAGDGGPLFIRTLALRCALVGTVMLAARMGDHILAAYQSVNAVWNFVLNMLDAIGISGQALVALQLGAGHRDQARKAVSMASKAGLVTGLLIAAAMLALAWLASPLFSPNPSIVRLIAIGMITQAVFLPLAGWMWALDGILIGARDYCYLAVTCTLTALVYIPALGAADAANGRILTTDTMRMVVLWMLINVLFIGPRAVFNGLRIRSDQWMH